MQTITLQKPIDLHCHFRDNASLIRTVNDCAKQFSHAIAMPNLTPPITTIEQLKTYQQRMLDALPKGNSFSPLMTFYLNNDVTVDTLKQAQQENLLAACKYYPKGVTTNAQHGVNNISGIEHLLNCMQQLDIPLLLHGESADPSIDIFDREAHFIDHELSWIIQHFPKLRIVLEHITTAAAAQFIAACPSNVAATITAHHLYIDRNDLLSGGIKPDLYCLPIAKRLADKNALIAAAISGDPHFFLGTDSAPHTAEHKYNACGCAGIYTSYHAMALYADIFEQHNALDKLENFASTFGRAFYRLEPSNETITLIKKPQSIPQTLTMGDSNVVPFRATKTCNWQLSI